MCGIVGYIGNKEIDTTLVESLKLLEYRGYDSAGVAVMGENGIMVTKTAGKIDQLKDILPHHKASCGIAHTRWATHGAPTTINAHPHTSQDKSWAIVHNGIIENFGELKSQIQSQGVQLASETDTEVIVQMLSLSKYKNVEALIDVCHQLKGSFALACMHQDSPDTLYLAKQKSPLYLSADNGEVYVASDTICFAGRTTSYYALADGEFCAVSANGAIFYNQDGVEIVKEPIALTQFDQDVGKKDYPHFMLKEIMETPKVLQDIHKVYTERGVLASFDAEFMSRFDKIYLIGCGTAYNASCLGAKWIEKYARIPARSMIASEFRYANPLVDNRTLCIFVSQSGETADTLGACELCKMNGAYTLALTNVLYSALAKMVDIVLPVCAGREIAVASTKAYTAQIAILYMLARQLGNVVQNGDFNYLAQLKDLSTRLIMPDQTKLLSLVQGLKGEDKVFFIGRDVDYLTCEESSLKLKEITYINSSAYPAGELKHGFLALIESGTYVFVIATQKTLLDKTLNGAHEAQARGAKLVLVTQLDISQEKLSNVHSVIQLPNFDQEIMPIVSIGVFQLISYMTSVERGLNPDQPRNLAKSVTVE